MATLNLFTNAKQDRYYVRLDILDMQENLSIGAKLLSMTLIESLSSYLPYLTVKFIDYDAILFSKLIIPPDSVFLLTYGTSSKDTKQSKFLLNVVKYHQVSPEGLSEMVVELTLSGVEWIPLFSTTKSRSWTDIKYSDVIGELAKEIGVKKTQIEPTKGTQNVIQPDWTNSQMVKFAATHAVNADGVGNYAFTINRHSELLFRTYNDLFSQQPKISISSMDTVQAKKYTNTNSLTPAFHNIENEQKYALNLQGGFGYEYTYFDYFTKKYITAKTDMRQSGEKQLTDWTYVSASHIGSGKRFDGGRDSNTPNVALTRSSLVVDSAQLQSFMVVANYDLNLGDIMDVKLPDSARTQKRKLNTVHGGKWLIWKLANVMAPDEGNFTTMVYLMRSGVGGNQDIARLVRTKGGKR